MKIRVFITDGDQLQLQNICDKFRCRMELGGPPCCDGQLSGFERPHEEGLKGGRTDWATAYLHVGRVGQALGIRTHFRHMLGLPAYMEKTP